MIEITKEEKRLITERYPNVHIRRTVKQKSKRGRYFMTEDTGPMRLLRAIREGKLVPTEKGG